MTFPATARTTQVADLQHKIDEADNDIALINRRLDEVQGMSWGGHCMHVPVFDHDAKNCILKYA